MLKLRFFDYFSKAKTEESGQEDWSVSDTFGITLDFFYKLGFCLELGLLSSETETGTGVA